MNSVSFLFVRIGAFDGLVGWVTSIGFHNAFYVKRNRVRTLNRAYAYKHNGYHTRLCTFEDMVFGYENEKAGNCIEIEMDGRIGGLFFNGFCGRTPSELLFMVEIQLK